MDKLTRMGDPVIIHVLFSNRMFATRFSKILGSSRMMSSPDQVHCTISSTCNFKGNTAYKLFEIPRSPNID
ncbi:MAG: hypothetical protein ACXAEU_01105 [Candidatus Hodarchaeales archaeon]